MNPKDFYENFSLYQKINLTKIKEDEVKELIDYKGPIDILCPWCKSDSVFSIDEPIGTGGVKGGGRPYYNRLVEDFKKKEITGDYSGFIIEKTEYNYANKFYLKDFHCARNNEHLFLVVFLIQSNFLFKIGQYPSELDLIQKDFNKYTKVIDEKLVFEIKSSFLLNSHNFNVASLIHLRRAFEFVLEENHIKKISEIGWDEKKYLDSRLDEKIELLKDILPKKLLGHKSIYKILSKGVHQLEEEECKKAYVALFPIFILIFDELKFIRESERKEKDIQKNKSDFETNFNKS
jgi:hypothetical protein